MSDPILLCIPVSRTRLPGRSRRTSRHHHQLTTSVELEGQPRPYWVRDETRCRRRAADRTDRRRTITIGRLRALALMNYWMLSVLTTTGYDIATSPSPNYATVRVFPLWSVNILLWIIEKFSLYRIHNVVRIALLIIRILRISKF